MEAKFNFFWESNKMKTKKRSLLSFKCFSYFVPRNEEMTKKSFQFRNHYKLLKEAEKAAKFLSWAKIFKRCAAFSEPSQLSS